MFRKRATPTSPPPQPAPTERVTSVLGNGIAWKGDLTGAGGVRIEGAFEGKIHLRGLLVIGESGRVTCDHLVANVVIVAGVVRGDITTEKLEIRETGRVWGNVVTAAFSTEEGAFLRGQVRMEERVEVAPPAEEKSEAEPSPDEQTRPGITFSPGEAAGSGEERPGNETPAGQVTVNEEPSEKTP